MSSSEEEDYESDDFSGASLGFGGDYSDEEGYGGMGGAIDSDDSVGAAVDREAMDEADESSGEEKLDDDDDEDQDDEVSEIPPSVPSAPPPKLDLPALFLAAHGQLPPKRFRKLLATHILPLLASSVLLTKKRKEHISASVERAIKAQEAEHEFTKHIEFEERKKSLEDQVQHLAKRVQQNWKEVWELHVRPLPLSRGPLTI